MGTTLPFEVVPPTNHLRTPAAIHKKAAATREETRNSLYACALCEIRVEIGRRFVPPAIPAVIADTAQTMA